MQAIRNSHRVSVANSTLLGMTVGEVKREARELGLKPENITVEEYNEIESKRFSDSKIITDILFINIKDVDDMEALGTFCECFSLPPYWKCARDQRI